MRRERHEPAEDHAAVEGGHLLDGALERQPDDGRRAHPHAVLLAESAAVGPHGGGVDLAPWKVEDVDRMTLVEVGRELEAGAARLRAREDRGYETTSGIARLVPWFLLRPMLALASLLNGGIGVRAFGQPAHPLGSLFITNIGSFGLDEGYVAPVPLARVPLYVCVGAVADAPMAVNGQVEVRPRIVITATADHRLVDGAHAAKLARLVRGYLADPATIDRR